MRAQTFFIDNDEHGGRPLERIRRLRKQLEQFSPDAIVSHSVIPNIYSRLANRRSVPVVTVLHSASDDYRDAKMLLGERVLLRTRTALVVAVSAFQAHSFKERFGDRVPIIVVPNGIDTMSVPKSGYARNPTRVLTVARVAAQKNPQLWLDVASHFDTADAKLQFEWFGPESERSATETLELGANLLVNAEFMGPVERAADEMTAADLLFHPADREAQSIVLIEAASVGLPIVCAHHIDQQMPFPLASDTFEAGNPQSAIDALERVVSRYPEATERARSMVELVRETFSMQTTSARYLDEIRRVVPGALPKA